MAKKVKEDQKTVRKPLPETLLDKLDWMTSVYLSREGAGLLLDLICDTEILSGHDELIIAVKSLGNKLRGTFTSSPSIRPAIRSLQEQKREARARQRVREQADRLSAKQREDYRQQKKEFWSRNRLAQHRARARP